MNDPLIRFYADRQAARDAQDPMAAVCVLATVDDLGWPQARTLVLRDVNDGEFQGLGIYINASSPKWQQCQGPVCIQTWWPSVQVQYRMQVRCKALPKEHIGESWQLRPDAPKHMDWLYQQHAQGSEVSSRETLLQMLQDLSTPEPLTAPDGAKGLLLVPETVERLDLTQANGVHDRVRYHLQASGWEPHTLIP